VLDAYVAVLRDEVARAATYHLHDGMAAALDASCDRRGFAVGLGTGNIRAGAAVKLGRVGVYERFAFGGFGCDHEDRPAIVRVGAERGAASLGLPLARCRVVVIGDTPNDVAAARALGAESLAVETSGSAAAELRAAGATWAFADLAEPGALAALSGA
jgi:phosphoglycolate phosphatase-like HAD superfamily hydrolase